MVCGMAAIVLAAIALTASMSYYLYWSGCLTRAGQRRARA